MCAAQFLFSWFRLYTRFNFKFINFFSFSGASDPGSLCRDRKLEKLAESEFVCTFGSTDGGKFQAEVSLQHPEQGE